MRVYFQAQRQNTLRMFRTTGTARERAKAHWHEIERRNEGKALRLYRALCGGAIDEMHVMQKALAFLYTRDCQSADCVRQTVFLRKDGDLVPLSHHVCAGFDEFWMCARAGCKGHRVTAAALRKPSIG